MAAAAAQEGAKEAAAKAVGRARGRWASERWGLERQGRRSRGAGCVSAPAVQVVRAVHGELESRGIQHGVSRGAALLAPVSELRLWVGAQLDI